MKKTISMALAGLMLFTLIFTHLSTVMGSGGEAAAEDLPPRQELNFNTDWLYLPNDLSNGHMKELNDSGFERVSVPHANKILEKHKGNDFQKQIESFRFLSWYRRHFALDSSYAGKRIAVEFQAVATVAEVYVNGEYAGEHKGAYTSFTLDITEFVNTDGSDNVIAVRVDSRKRSDLPPEGGNVDFLLFGGIVRDVNMIITDPLHVEWTFVTTPDLTAASGKLDAQTKVVNSGSQAVTCKARTILRDADGAVVTTMTTPDALIGAGDSKVFEQLSDPISNPHLWNTDDPYLYEVVNQVLVNDECVEEYITKTGFRFFEFKDEPGDGNFYLNGEKTKISGINRHEQLPYIGRAVTNKMQVADADLIKDTGFNAVRTSHYPQDPEFLDRCDEIGLLVFTEPPGWQHIGDQAWQDEFTTNLEELIIRDRNHPSIISWGVRPNESVSNTAGDNTYRSFIQRNIALSKELDPTRPTHGVRIEYHYEQGSYCDEDLYTVNYRYPETPKFTPYLVAEYPMSWGRQGMEGTENYRHQGWIHDWADKADYYFGNDLVAGAFGWSMFDYNNEVNYTNTEYVFPSGLYDLFRNDKPVSWLFRSQKDPADETVLYIANYWAENAPAEVIVLSNCEEVELFRGNTSLGKITPNRYMNLPHPLFVFEGVAYSAADDLRAVGYIDGEAVEETVRKAPGTAARLTVEPEYDTLIADGTDLTMVTVTLEDANGTRLPYADNTVSIGVSGAGTFIGESSVKLEGGRIGFIVQSKYLEEGEITCTVTAPGVTAGECKITADPYLQETIVPVSQGSGSIRPMILYDVNDDKIGPGVGTFRFSGNWIYLIQDGHYMGDNTYSNNTDDSCEMIFSGEYIEFYGAKGSNHGIMAVSIDDGEETLIDCYSVSTQRNVRLYESGDLEPGIHTLRIRVTGTRNDAASDNYINVDRVSILTSETAVYTASESEYLKAGTLRTDTRADFTGASTTGGNPDWGVDGNGQWSNLALWIGRNTYIYAHPFTEEYARDKVLYFNFDYWVYRNHGNTDGQQSISVLSSGSAALDASLSLVTTPDNGFYGDDTWVHGGTDVCDMLVILDNINHTVSFYRNGILIGYREVSADKVLTGLAIHGGTTEYITGLHDVRYGQLGMTDLTVAVSGETVACMMTSFPLEAGDSGLLAIYDAEGRLVNVWEDPEPSMTFTLPAGNYTASGFLWDSDMKPLLKQAKLSFSTE